MSKTKSVNGKAAKSAQKKPAARPVQGNGNGAQVEIPPDVKRAVDRMINACERAEDSLRAAGVKSVEVSFEPEAEQMSDADRIVLAAEVRAAAGHVFSEASALMALTNPRVQMDPAALLSHFRRVTVAANAGLVLVAGK